MMNWSTGGHFGLMGLWWILVLAAVVAAVWIAVAAGRDRRGGGPESPEQLLKGRYANGEIDRATYQRMLKELRR